MVGVPFTEIATSIGTRVIKNVVALGALQAVTEHLPGRDVPGGDPAGLGRQVCHDPHERRGLPVGSEGGIGGDGRE